MRRKFLSKTAKLARNECGAISIEYGLLAACLSGATISGGVIFQEEISASFVAIGEEIGLVVGGEITGGGDGDGSGGGNPAPILIIDPVPPRPVAPPGSGIGGPDPVVEPEIGGPDPVVKPEIGGPDPAVEPEIGGPDPVVEPITETGPSSPPDESCGDSLLMTPEAEQLSQDSSCTAVCGIQEGLADDGRQNCEPLILPKPENPIPPAPKTNRISGTLSPPSNEFGYRALRWTYPVFYEEGQDNTMQVIQRGIVLYEFQLPADPTEPVWIVSLKLGATDDPYDFEVRSKRTMVWPMDENDHPQVVAGRPDAVPSDIIDAIEANTNFPTPADVCGATHPTVSYWRSQCTLDEYQDYMKAREGIRG